MSSACTHQLRRLSGQPFDLVDPARLQETILDKPAAAAGEDAGKGQILAECSRVDATRWDKGDVGIAAETALRKPTPPMVEAGKTFRV